MHERSGFRALWRGAERQGAGASKSPVHEPRAPHPGSHESKDPEEEALTDEIIEPSASKKPKLQKEPSEKSKGTQSKAYHQCKPTAKPKPKKKPAPKNSPKQPRVKR